MNLAPAQLSEHLKRGLKNLYTLQGDEPLLLQEFADALRAAARQQGYTERTVHTVSGAHFDWSEVLASGGSLSLFADKQIVEIRIPSGKPGKDGSVALQQLAERAQRDDATLTLITLPKLDSMTTKGAWFGALDSFGVTVRFEPIDRRVLPQWIAQRLQWQGQRLNTLFRKYWICGDRFCNPAILPLDRVVQLPISHCRGCCCGCTSRRWRSR